MQDVINFAEFLEKIVDSEKNEREEWIKERIRNSKEERLIKKVLDELKISPKLDGYKYLIDVIQICIDNPNAIMCLYKLAYPIIAKKYNVSRSSIDSCMNTVIKKAWIYNDSKTVLKIFGNAIDNITEKAPRNKQFIRGVVSYIIGEKEKSRKCKTSKLDELRELGWNNQDIEQLLRELKIQFMDIVKLSTQEDANTVERVVDKILSELGFHFETAVFKYLKTSILYYFENGMIGCMSQNLYPYVANKYNTTYSKVESAIYSAVGKISIKNNSLANEIWGNITDGESRLKVSEFFVGVYEFLNRHYS